MRIRLATKVKGNYREVIKRFDLELFEALAPKAAKMEIVEFTGSQRGDRVHIRFHKPVKAEWISAITEDHIDEREAYFIDEGVLLPFPLATWKHRHLVQKVDADHSLIIDEIDFTGRFFLLTLLLYPAVYAGFYPRKRIYQRIFGC